MCAFLVTAERRDHRNVVAHAAFRYGYVSRIACRSQVMPSLSSVMETIGMNLANSEKFIRNQPKLPIVSTISVSFGTKNRPGDGWVLVASEPAMMTKRSSHIPIFTNIERIKSQTVF